MNKTMSPSQALEKLINGNDRFIAGVRSVESLLGQSKMAELAENGQKPFAIVLTCSDSRSPVEMIFDQGLGDVFVVRVAGNVVAPSLLASIEFAAANFGSPLIVVMGHTKCGAVGATLDHVNNPQQALPSPYLEELVSRIRPAVEKVQSRYSGQKDILEQATQENVRRSMSLILEQSTIVRNLCKENKIAITGAVLDIRTGKVSFLETTTVAKTTDVQPLKIGIA